MRYLPNLFACTVFIWTLKLEAVDRILSQCGHCCGFSQSLNFFTLCVFLCLIITDIRSVTKSHLSQVCVLCLAICRFSWLNDIFNSEKLAIWPWINKCFVAFCALMLFLTFNMCQLMRRSILLSSKCCITMWALKLKISYTV